jgi:hypothetical protein
MDDTNYAYHDLDALCFEGHTWVTERYIDHGNWNTEEAE